MVIRLQSIYCIDKIRSWSLLLKEVTQIRFINCIQRWAWYIYLVYSVRLIISLWQIWIIVLNNIQLFSQSSLHLSLKVLVPYQIRGFIVYQMTYTTYFTMFSQTTWLTEFHVHTVKNAFGDGVSPFSRCAFQYSFTHFEAPCSQNVTIQIEIQVLTWTNSNSFTITIDILCGVYLPSLTYMLKVSEYILLQLK